VHDGGKFERFPTTTRYDNTLKRWCPTITLHVATCFHFESWSP
jgi:hypothetical protein